MKESNKTPNAGDGNGSKSLFFFKGPSGSVNFSSKKREREGSLRRLFLGIGLFVQNLMDM